MLKTEIFIVHLVILLGHHFRNLEFLVEFLFCHNAFHYIGHGKMMHLFDALSMKGLLRIALILNSIYYEN